MPRPYVLSVICGTLWANIFCYKWANLMPSLCLILTFCMYGINWILLFIWCLLSLWLDDKPLIHHSMIELANSEVHFFIILKSKPCPINNPSRPSAAYIRQWVGLALVQIIACFAYSASSQYLNQCWVIVNWTLRNKLQWKFNQNTKFSFTKMLLKISFN